MCIRDRIRDDYAPMDIENLPPFFDEMKKSAQILCKDFPFVRVDFFIANGRYYFAELTFTPVSYTHLCSADRKNGRRFRTGDLCQCCQPQNGKQRKRTAHQCKTEFTGRNSD